MTVDEIPTPPDPLDGLEDRLAAIAEAHAADVPIRPDDIDVLLGAVRLLRTAGDAIVGHDAAARVRRMVAAETDVVGLRAQVTALTGRLEETEYERYNAEQALSELRDSYPRRLYVPGDAEPDRDESPDRPLVLAALGGGGFSAGRLFARASGYYDRPWRSLDATSTSYDWRSLMEHAPLLDLAGAGSWRLAAWCRDAHAEQDERRRDDWKLEEILRRAARHYPGLREGPTPPLVLPDRPADPTTRRRAITAAVRHALDRLPHYAAKAREPAQ